MTWHDVTISVSVTSRDDMMTWHNMTARCQLPAAFIDIIISVDVEAILTDSAQIFFHLVWRLTAAAQSVDHIDPRIEVGHLDYPVELPDHRRMEGDDDLLLHQALDPVELPGVVLGLEEVVEGGDGVTEEMPDQNKTEQQWFHFFTEKERELKVVAAQLSSVDSQVVDPDQHLEARELQLLDLLSVVLQ